MQADITRTQAQATSDAQQILACGGTTTTQLQDGKSVQVVTPNPNNRCSAPPLTAEILQYSYIQALRDLVNSPNSSTVILGGGTGAAPIIQVPGATGRHHQHDHGPQLALIPAPAAAGLHVLHDAGRLGTARRRPCPRW